MMRKLLIAAGLAAVAACTAVPSLAADKATQKFVTEAIQGNLAEVEMGKLAQDKGATDGVKNYGKELADDHSAANQKATALANSIGVTPPTEPTKKQKAEHDKLAKMSGAAFDRAFIKAMIADHKKDIKTYQQQAKKQSEAAQYAKDTLPVLQKHLEDVQALQKSDKSAAR